MSESADSRPKSVSPPSASADARTLEHVEKWMAVIRELNGERRAQAKLAD